MPSYFEFVGNSAAHPLVLLDENKVPRVVLDCTETRASFPADNQAAILAWLSAQNDRFPVGSGPMNIRPILKWNDDGDHMVRVYGLRRYVWSS